MEVYRTINGHVAKYVHDDGSETAIKTIPPGEVGCGGYGSIGNKYNIFISTSVGCPVSCKFCYLTVKKCPYHKLTARDVVLNVLDALTAELKERPELRDMYTKISWMGMGDGFFDTSLVFEATEDLMEYIQSFEMSLGIDGVDIATTLPKIPDGPVDYIKKISESVWETYLNPKRKYKRGSSQQPFRVFYSLQSANESTRKSLIPNSVNISDAIDYLKNLNNNNIPIIFHYMFFEGKNDSEEEVTALLKLLNNFNNSELRLLRFNKCPGTDFSESPKFNELVDTIYTKHKNLKVQISPGSEIQAACGMFLLSKILTK